MFSLSVYLLILNEKHCHNHVCLSLIYVQIKYLNWKHLQKCFVYRCYICKETSPVAGAIVACTVGLRVTIPGVLNGFSQSVENMYVFENHVRCHFTYG